MCRRLSSATEYGRSNEPSWRSASTLRSGGYDSLSNMAFARLFPIDAIGVQDDADAAHVVARGAQRGGDEHASIGVHLSEQFKAQVLH
jgi:hypothetical protein